MSAKSRTLLTICAVLCMLGSWDFITRVHISSAAKKYQENEVVIPPVFNSSGVPEDLATVIAGYHSGAQQKGKQQTVATGESGALANFRFSLIAIYQKSGQYTAVVAVENLKDQQTETIKMNAATIYSDVSVQQLEQKFIVLAHQQQTIRLRLFEKSGSKT
jgi:hypothetical protein